MSVLESIRDTLGVRRQTGAEPSTPQPRPEPPVLDWVMLRVKCDAEWKRRRVSVSINCFCNVKTIRFWRMKWDDPWMLIYVPPFDDMWHMATDLLPENVHADLIITGYHSAEENLPDHMPDDTEIEQWGLTVHYRYDGFRATYPILLTPCGAGYEAMAWDMPDITIRASTLTDALLNVEDKLVNRLKTLLDKGDKPPEASDFRNIQPADSEAMIVPLAVDLSR